MREAGFTIVEILVVVVILAILATIGIPSLSGFANEMRLGSAMGELSNDIYFARSEAIKRNTSVMICARSTAASMVCSTAGSTTAWMNGWLVCFDADADNACDAGGATDPNPMRVHAALASPLSLSGPASAVAFRPTGSATAGSFTMTGGTTTTRTATVAGSGSVSVRKS